MSGMTEATAADIPTERTSVDDRLTVMLVLAGLFHLIVILGVTFAAPDTDLGPVPTLEVLIVSDALPESEVNDDPRYLSQRTQQGAGNLRDPGRTQLPTLANASADSQGEPAAADDAGLPQGPTGGAPQALTSSRDSGRTRFQADAQEPADAAEVAPRQQLAGADTILPASEDDPEMRIKGASSRELMLSPSTRESSATLYIDDWRRKVERVGTLNFPNQARRSSMSGNPVIEVALGSDGRLVDARVRRSSGYPELDQAAIEILRLAAPFEPFPQALSQRYDLLRFAYEWQFVGGQLAGSSVRLPAGTR